MPRFARPISPAARVALALSACLCACGSENPAGDGGTAGVDAERPPAPFLPWLAEGAPPIAPPDFAGCPEGWQEVEAAGATVCEPWPGDAASCPSGEARFPGEEACTRVGSSCPADGFPEGLPADTTVVHVLAGSTGGDGSRARPYGAPSEFSVSGLPGGSVVALGRGTYDSIRLARGIVLWGACPGETTVTASTADRSAGTIQVVGAGAEVRNLSVSGGSRAGVSALRDGDSIHLRDVWIEGVAGTGLLALRGGVITGERVVVRDTAPLADGTRGRAIHAESGASTELRHALLEGNRDVCAFVGRVGSRLVLEDAALRATGPSATDLSSGRAINAELDGHVELRRAALERQRDVALFVGDPGSSAILEDVVVRGTESSRASGLDGTGVAITLGAVAAGARLWVHESRAAGLFSREDSSVVLSDVVISDTRAQEADGRRGAGVDVGGQAQVELTRGVISGSPVVGAIVGGTGASMHVEDLVVRDTLGQSSDGAFGRGLSIQLGGSASGSRILVERSREIGLFASGPAADVRFEDIVVRDTSGDVVGRLGRGLSAQLEATVRVTRGLFDRNRETALLAGSEATHVAIHQTVVRDTRPRECVSDRCADEGMGHGIGAYLSGRVTAEDFLVVGSALCGAHLAVDGEMDLARGEISGSPIGVCVQVDGYDLERLQNGVRYLDNESNLMATTLPVPDVVTPGPEGG